MEEVSVLQQNVRGSEEQNIRKQNDRTSEDQNNRTAMVANGIAECGMKPSPEPRGAQNILHFSFFIPNF